MTKTTPETPKTNEKLERGQRLRQAWMFREIHENGEFAKGRYLNLWICRDKNARFGEIEKPKVGIVVSRKTSARANQRNLWKRRIREVFRKNQNRIKPETVMLLQAKTAKKVPAYAELAADLMAQLEKTGSLKK